MENIIYPSSAHKELDGVALAKARERRGLTAYQFSLECGWTPQYQSKLEFPGRKEVPVDTAQTLLNILDKFSVIDIT